MKKKIEPQQLKEIKNLPTFEAKCEYWKETFACSFFQTLVESKQKGFRLVDEADKDEDAQILVRYEMERVIEQHPAILMMETRKRMFEDLNRSKSFDLLKENLIQELEQLLCNGNKQLRLGFRNYKGLYELNDIVSAFRRVYDFKIYEPTTIALHVRNFIKGFKIAELLEAIKDHTKTIKPRELESSDNRIEVKQSMQVFAAIIYYFGVKAEVFPLFYKTDKSYNGSATANYYRKHFKVLTENGEEVKDVTFRNCFKQSNIQTLTNNEVLRALKRFPFNTME